MTTAIQINRIHKHFGALHALKGIDLSIEQGEFFALLGPNGAGKSTLINILAGLIKPSSGDISVLGFDVVEQQLKCFNFRAIAAWLIGDK